jgi:regulator of sirC expression with transglutaminase-like and TPR domain
MPEKTRNAEQGSALRLELGQGSIERATQSGRVWGFTCLNETYRKHNRCFLNQVSERRDLGA